VNPTIEQLAMALIAVRGAQHHLRKAACGLAETGIVDSMAFDLERMVAEIVDTAKSVQSQSATR